MSTTRTYKPRIIVPQLQQHRGNIKGTPTMAIMRMALEKVAAEHRGSLTSGYRDCLGKLHETIIGITTPDLPNGLGIDVDPENGTVVYRYDQEKANASAAKQLCRDISRTYAVTAVMQAQKRLGYRVKVLEEKKNPEGRKVITQAIKN